MTQRYTVRRDASGLSVPFGAHGIAGISAIVGALAGIMMPTHILESISYQAYLDRLTAAAAPPFGTTAHVAFALVLGALLAAIGYGIARYLRVESSGGVGDLLYRLRGHDRQDEADAPALRSADRHPDAPARRPLSAARDLPSQDDDNSGAYHAALTNEGDQYIHVDDDELLLDGGFEHAADPAHTHAWDAEIHDAAAANPVDYADDHDDTDHTIANHSVDPAPAGADGWLTDEAPALPPTSRPTNIPIEPIDEADEFYIAPPHLDDWQYTARDALTQHATSESAPTVADMIPETASAPAAFADPAPSATPAARPVPPPLDLSAARLDELIARLEAGLTRRQAVDQAPALPAISTGDAPAVAAGIAHADLRDDDPAFPHDPALAAALATLRKMTRHVG